MAKSVSFRKFTDGGDVVAFSSLKFRKVLDDIVRQKKEEGERCTKNELYELISEKACVSVEAVRKWQSGHNGVSDLKTVKDIAAALGINYGDLIVKGESKGERDMVQDFDPVSSNEKELLMQMHKLFTDYIYWFLGTEMHSYANEVLEKPWEEQERYVINLYRFLDSISLSVSKDAYKKLRVIITQLDQMFRTIPIYIAKPWMEINPRLSSDIFHEVLDSSAETIDEFLFDELSYDPEEMHHMLFEDMPEFKESYDKVTIKPEIKQKNDKGYYFLKLEESLPGMRDYYYETPLYSLVVRELSSTLTMVMEYYFPEYCGKER